MFTTLACRSGSTRRRTWTTASSSSSVSACVIARPDTTVGSLGCDEVRIHVRLFAGLRERAGWSQREVDGVARVDDVWRALDLGEEPPGLLYAVNKSYVRREHELSDGDEVALLPPVSGGTFRLREQPLSIEAVADEVASDEAGAVATFVGTTRV